MDREEFYRLKKVSKITFDESFGALANRVQVKNNKQRDYEAAERDNAEKRRDSNKENDELEGPSDLLANEEDQDVIF